MSSSNNDPNDQKIINEAFVESLKARDARWRDLDVAIKIEHELQTSVALKIVLEQVNQEAALALEKLVDADATDAKLITALQARVQRARIIGNTLEAVRRKGALAEASLEQDSQSVNPQGED